MFILLTFIKTFLIIPNFMFFSRQLAKKGQHAIRDAQIRNGMHKSIVEYEQLEAMLRDENAQQDELDCLNYLAGKQIVELFKAVPTETDVIPSCSYPKSGNFRNFGKRTQIVICLNFLFVATFRFINFGKCMLRHCNKNAIDIYKCDEIPNQI